MKVVWHLALAFFLDWLFMLAWNEEMPRLFRMPVISYKDAILLTFIGISLTTRMTQAVRIETE